MSTDAWMGLAGAALGGLIGIASALLSIVASQRDARRQRAAAVEVARHTIIAEVLVNRENLARDKQWVRDPDTPADLAPIERSGIYPPPAMITSAWDGQIAILSHAFTLDEIIDLQRFYTHAQSVQETRKALHTLYVEDAPRVGLLQAFSVYEAYAEAALDYAVPGRLSKYVPDLNPRKARKTVSAV